MSLNLTRREFLSLTAGGAVTAWAGSGLAADPPVDFQLRYVLASCMYGTASLAEILPEVAQTGSEALDVWPKPHGNQREQITAMGAEAFGKLLDQHGVRLGMLTHYDLGPFALEQDAELARRFGVKLIITGGSGPKGLKGNELKSAVREFVQKLKPHILSAERAGYVIGIENHANNLIESPDSLRWLAEFSPSPHLGVALAPYHLPQDEELLAGLIRDLDKKLVHFYAWEHGHGCMTKLPKEEELLQLPGRGPLDFRPLIAALKQIDYRGWTEIFMHPVPRGIPILDTTDAVTAEINCRREYLERLTRC